MLVFNVKPAWHPSSLSPHKLDLALYLHLTAQNTCTNWPDRRHACQFSVPLRREIRVTVAVPEFEISAWIDVDRCRYRYSSSLLLRWPS
ncbi:hypothetical protein IFR05_013129 [Cadophora sp. M221]|nr:hypothetical protein IFR05_013129 [Cadophora sp. M221]